MITVAPPLSALRITKFVLFQRLLIAIRSSLLMLLFGGLELRRITAQSCLIGSLSSSARVLMLSSMQQIRLSIGMEEGEMEKFKPLFRTLNSEWFSSYEEIFTTFFASLLLLAFSFWLSSCLMIQVDIGGHPPFPNGSKQFSGHFGNLLFLAGFHLRGHFEGLNEVFSRSRFSMIV
jgi:hypothetical protein